MAAEVGATFALGTETTAIDASVPWASTDPPNSKALLALRNVGEETLGFKILTNAPQRWSVRPAFGLLLPGDTAEVTLALMADMRSESEDRHLVLSVPLGAEEAALLAEQRKANERVSIERLSPTNPGVSQIRLTLGTPPTASGEAAGSTKGLAAEARSSIAVAQNPPQHLSDPAAGGADDPRAWLVTLAQTFVRTALDEVSPWFKWKVYDIIFALLLLRLGRRFRPIRWLQRWLRELDA